MKKILLIYFFPVALALLVAVACHRSSPQKMRLCDQTYALCTSARCIPLPGNPAQAVCFCQVREGKSVSTAPCSDLKPSADEHGVQTVYSTFSFDEFNYGFKGMKCPSGTPWTWCLNKKCTADPSDPHQALCICDVIRTGEWMTAGGRCKTSTCNTGYWSGATLEAVAESERFLMGELGLKQSPIQWCQR